MCCGIVLAASKNFNSKDMGLFDKLLHADTFRGPHSTGVFTRREIKIGKDEHVSVPMYKKAVEGPEFLKLYEYETLVKGWGTATTYGSFYIGHNRWATQGAVNDINAHPFKEGVITMVHNGTLLDQSLLPDHTNYEVDSENICHSLNKMGANATIQKLDGAFVVIWHNSDEDQLHIIRNKERPFHLLETTCGKWFGASEEDMLLWVIKRSKIPYIVKRHFECEVGTEYIFDTFKGEFILRDQIKHKLPDFIKDYYNDYDSGWGAYGDGYGRNYSRAPKYEKSANSRGSIFGNTGKKPVKTKLETECNELLKSHNLEYKYGSLLTFTPYEFTSYMVGGKIGKIMGYIEGEDDYYEVISHQCQEGEFTLYQAMETHILNARLENNELVIVTNGATRVALKEVDTVDNVLPFRQELDDVNFNEMELIDKECEPKTISIGGCLYTREQWDRGTRKDCGQCSETVKFDEAEECNDYLGSILCLDCEENMYDTVEDIGWGYKRKDALSEGSFICKTCDDRHPAIDESQMYETCQGCYDYFATLYNIH
jgi:hypothetical protein